MLEDIIDHPKQYCKNDGGEHNEERRALQLLPARPGGLLGKLDERVLQIVNKLSHLYF